MSEHERLFNRFSRNFLDIENFLNGGSVGPVDAPHEPSWEERSPGAVMNNVERYFVCPQFTPGDLIELQGKILDSGQEAFASFTALPIYDSPSLSKTPTVYLDHLIVVNTLDDEDDFFQASPGDHLLIQGGIVVGVE